MKNNPPPHRSDAALRFKTTPFVEYERGTLWYAGFFVAVTAYLSWCLFTASFVSLFAGLVVLGLYILLHHADAAPEAVVISRRGVDINGRLIHAKSIEYFALEWDEPFVQNIKLFLREEKRPRRVAHAVLIHALGQDKKQLRRALTAAGIEEKEGHKRPLAENIVHILRL